VAKAGSVLVVMAAVGAALVPLPASGVERWYSRGVYAHLQPAMTGVSSLVPIAIFDVAAIALLVLLIAPAISRWRTSGAVRALAGLGWRVLVTSAVVYLLFLLCWGLNYQRILLESRVDYAEARVTPEAALGFAREALRQVNALAAVPRVPARDEDLKQAFARAQQVLGDPATTRMAAPKRSLLTWYFRQSGIDGLTVPWFLEVIVNPDMLPAERPFTVAHEWAHLAGYAHETDANFVAWLTCVGASDPMVRYSGWLTAYRRASRAVPREERRALRNALHPAAVSDLVGINERLSRANPVVSRTAARVYDSYLRASGVDEGIASYGAVLRLMIGTTFDADWNPRLRTSQQESRLQQERGEQTHKSTRAQDNKSKTTRDQEIRRSREQESRVRIGDCNVQRCL
jgi:hypothetical protein